MRSSCCLANCACNARIWYQCILNTFQPTDMHSQSDSGWRQYILLQPFLCIFAQMTPFPYTMCQPSRFNILSIMLRCHWFQTKLDFLLCSFCHTDKLEFIFQFFFLLRIFASFAFNVASDRIQFLALLFNCAASSNSVIVFSFSLS